MSDEALPNLLPGPRDEGGQGGMASREYDARKAREAGAEDPADPADGPELTDLDIPEIGRGIEEVPKD
jgi:hypothetical protein